jgi:hypothetical protein
VAEGDEVPEGDDVPEGEPAAAEVAGAVGVPAEPDGDVLPGELLLPDGVAVGEDEDGVGVGGVGVGVGLPGTGTTSHLVSVFAFALAEALELAEALALRVAAASCAVPAWTAPGPPASTPRARKPPDSTPRTAARTCARRMKLALSTLLIDVTVCSSWDSEATG